MSLLPSAEKWISLMSSLWPVSVVVWISFITYRRHRAACAEWSSHRIGALGSALFLTGISVGMEHRSPLASVPRLTSQICSCPSCASNARRSFVGKYELQGTHGYAPQCSAVLNSTHVGYHKYSLGTLVCKGTGLKACQLLKAAAADELSDSAADSSPSCARISTGVAH